MDYQQIKHIITHIEDTGIADDQKREAIKTICDGNIDYLTVQDLQNALSWFWSDVSFSRAIQKLNIIRLEERLKHLLSSEFIRSFDEVDHRTGKYIRDIKDADVVVRASDVVNKIVEMLPEVVNNIVASLPDIIKNLSEDHQN